MRGGVPHTHLCPLRVLTLSSCSSSSSAVCRICRHGCEECETLGVCLIEQEGRVDCWGTQACPFHCWHGDRWLGACTFACEVARLTWIGLCAPHALGLGPRCRITDGIRGTLAGCRSPAVRMLLIMACLAHQSGAVFVLHSLRAVQSSLADFAELLSVGIVHRLTATGSQRILCAHR